jgi:tetratricopeptide (TPR) repeat protein
MKHWADDPLVAAGLVEHASDVDPLVRAMAARALESALARPQVTSTLEKLAEDPVRAVRVEAAWGLRNHLDTNSTAGLDLLRYIEFNLDQPSGRLQMGTFELDRGNVPEAIAHFRRAIQWDKNSPPLHHALAVALSISGNAAEAVRALEAACELSPEDAGYRFRLALALNEAGRRAEATQALEKAVELDPRFARAWYNLGLAYAAEERLSEALTALERAEAVEAGNPEFPYARATVLARLGMMHEAREASRRALDIDPGFTPASQLLRGISGAPGSR